MNDLITIETKTWDQNKENLFDYESNSLKRKLLTTNTPSIQIYPNPQSLSKRGEAMQDMLRQSGLNRKPPSQLLSLSGFLEIFAFELHAGMDEE